MIPNIIGMKRKRLILELNGFLAFDPTSPSITEKYEWKEKSAKSRTIVHAPQTQVQVPSY